MRELIIGVALLLCGCKTDHRDPDVERAAMQECLEASGGKANFDIMVQCRSFAADVARQAYHQDDAREQSDPRPPSE